MIHLLPLILASIGYFEILMAIFLCFLFFFLHFLSHNEGLPRNYPVVGMLPGLFLDLHRINDKLIETLELSNCTFLFRGPWFSNMNILLTVSPANVQHVMSTNFSNYLKGPEFKRIFDILGEGFFNADLESWSNQRRVAQALITDKRFYNFLVRIIREKVAKALIPVLEEVTKNGAVIDLQELFQRLGKDITWIFVAGYDPESLSIDFPDVELLKAVEDAEEVIFHRHVRPECFWRFQKWLGVGQERKLSKAWETIDKFIADYLSSKQENLKNLTEIEEEQGVSGDLLTSYMKEGSAIGMKLDNKFLRDTVLNFLIAGRESIGSTLNWFFWLVSTNPFVEATIREELNLIKPQKEDNEGGFFDLEPIQKMVYLHAALCETLRLYPPVPFQHKAPVKPDILPSGHFVDPSIKIVFPRFAMGRMVSIWGEDCHEFKPERWISEDGGLKKESSYKFFSCNAGPRICPGKEMSFIQLKAIAANVIYSYDVQLVEGHKVVPSNSVILHMMYGLKVKISKRA